MQSLHTDAPRITGLILRIQYFSGLTLGVLTCSRVKGQTSKAASICGIKMCQEGIQCEAIRGSTCFHDFRGCLRPASVTAAAPGQMVLALSNCSESGHMTAQSDFAARGTRDVQAAQEALSGQMMR